MKRRSKIIWLVAVVLLGMMLAAGNSSQSADEERTYNPVAEARKKVDGFLRAYRPGLDESTLMSMLCDVREWMGPLRDIGDLRLVKPLAEILADTSAHSDDVSSNVIFMLRQLRVRSALPAIRPYLNLYSKPASRLEAAIALAVLGEAEVGIPVLEELAPQGRASLTWALLNYGRRAIQLNNPVQESIVVSYFQRISEKATGQELVYVICYLLQKDDKSRAIAFSRAEDVLKTSPASADTTILHNIRVLLKRFGGEHGKVLLNKYQ